MERQINDGEQIIMSQQTLAGSCNFLAVRIVSKNTPRVLKLPENNNIFPWPYVRTRQCSVGHYCRA